LGTLGPGHSKSANTYAYDPSYRAPSGSEALADRIYSVWRSRWKRG
jgi:hypothetical protein